MRALPASAVLLGALLLGGCGGEHSSGTPDFGTTPTTTTTSTAPEPSDPPDPTDSVSGTFTSSDEPLPVLDQLLPTGLVPGLNAQWKWQDGDTGTPKSDPLGVCAKADLPSIGADNVVGRTYFPPDDSDDNAAEQIAEFPDANTAARAWAVLKSWHDGCAARASDHPGLTVGTLTPVAVRSGTARWYLLSWKPAGEETNRYESYGMVLTGNRIAVLLIDNSAKRHDYPPGSDPMVGMITAAVGWLH